MQLARLLLAGLLSLAIVTSPVVGHTEQRRGRSDRSTGSEQQKQSTRPESPDPFKPVPGGSYDPFRLAPVPSYDPFRPPAAGTYSSFSPLAPAQLGVSTSPPRSGAGHGRRTGRHRTPVVYIGPYFGAPGVVLEPLSSGAHVELVAPSPVGSVTPGWPTASAITSFSSADGPDGGLSLEITPRHAEAFVDGLYMGVVGEHAPPFVPLPLAPGSHQIEVRLEGYRPMTFTVVVTAGTVVAYRGVMDPTR